MWGKAVDFPAPAGLTARDYQLAGAHHLVRNRACLLADEPGAGKTIQVALALNAAAPGIPIFIGCPETLMINWMRELSKWLVTPRTVGLASAKHIPNTEIVIANYDIFPRLTDFFRRQPFAVAVLDEGHRIKTPSSQRTQAACLIHAGHRWILSGTPILNRPIEAWALLWWLMRERVMDYGIYAKHFCNAHLREIWVKRKDRQGVLEAKKKKVWSLDGAAHLDELHNYLVQEAHMLRRRKVDVLAELPDKTHQVIELNAERVRKLLKNEARLADRLGGYEAAIAALQDSEKAVGFTEFTDVRHELGLAKMDQAVEFIEDALQEEPKVVVFCHHRDVLAGLREQLKAYKPVCIWGGLSAGDKDNAVQQFQNNPDVRVFIGNDAACEGLTLTAASRCIFVELDPVPGRMEQFEDRLHRIGQKDAVLVQALVFAQSLDVRLIKLLWSKSKAIDQAVNGTK